MAGQADQKSASEVFSSVRSRLAYLGEREAARARGFVARPDGGWDYFPGEREPSGFRIDEATRQEILDVERRGPMRRYVIQLTSYLLVVFAAQSSMLARFTRSWLILIPALLLLSVVTTMIELRLRRRAIDRVLERSGAPRTGFNAS
jgi:hypothetical protein